VSGALLDRMWRCCHGTPEPSANRRPSSSLRHGCGRLMQRTSLGANGRYDIDRDLGPVAAAVAECPGIPGMSEPHHEGPLQEVQPLLPGSRHANTAHPGPREAISRPCTGAVPVTVSLWRLRKRCGHRCPPRADGRCEKCGDAHPPPVAATSDNTTTHAGEAREPTPRPFVIPSEVEGSRSLTRTAEIPRPARDDGAGGGRARSGVLGPFGASLG
jgi:hypothetical protein